MNDVQWPDGIKPRHIHEAHGSGFRSLGSIILLGLLLAASLFGLFGIRDTLTAAGDGVRLAVEGPKRIRSGEYFEMLFTIETEREIRDAALSVDTRIWHDVTINTIIPQPTEEDFRDGSFEFHFGALPPGSRLAVKIDGQINPAYPPGLNEGKVAVVDGAAILAAVEYSMRILP
jgi:hypothetical protein